MLGPVVSPVPRLAVVVLLAGASLVQPSLAQSNARRDADDGSGLAALADAAAWRVVEVGDGVFLRQRLLPLFGAPQSLSVLELPPQGVRFDVTAPGKRTKTSAMGEAGGALAAVNGGYFAIKDTGLSIGLLRLDGRLVVPADERQASLGIARDGSLSLAVRPAGDWPEVYEALGAGPMLLAAGKVVEPKGRSRTDRHPRTAVGLRHGGGAILLTVDGRHAEAVGTTFEETARVLAALGCVDALNLDGGGSTTLWVAGRGVCNFPCDDKRFDHAGERTVANALLVHAPAVVVVDDDDAELAGDGWRQRTDGERFLGRDFASSAAPDAHAIVRARLPFAGTWRVLVWRPQVAGSGGTAAVAVALPGAREAVRVRGESAQWVAAGQLTVPDLGDRTVEVRVAPAGGELVVDGVRFVQVLVAPTK